MAKNYYFIYKFDGTDHGFIKMYSKKGQIGRGMIKHHGNNNNNSLTKLSYMAIIKN